MKPKSKQVLLGIRVPQSLANDLDSDARFFRRGKEAIISELLRIHFLFKRNERAKVYVHIPLKRMGRPFAKVAASTLLILCLPGTVVPAPLPQGGHLTPPPASLYLPAPKNRPETVQDAPKAHLNPALCTITAYCPCQICCGKAASGLCADGRKPAQGVTVAASRRIPLGTHLRIEGLPNDFIVQDRLAKRFDDRVDIFFNSHAEAKRFGIKTMKITVYD